MLTSLVTLLDVAGPCLHRRAFASVVQTVAGAAALLDPIATCRGAGSPLGPGGPAIISRVAGYGEKRGHLAPNVSDELLFRGLCRGPIIARGCKATGFFLEILLLSILLVLWKHH